MSNQELLNKLNELQELKRVRDEAAEAVEALTEEIKDYMSDHNQESMYLGPYHITYKYQESSRIDRKKLETEHPEIASMYLTKSGYHKLMIT